MPLAPTSAPLLGEPLPVELMNTIWADRDGVHDALATPAETLAWVRAIQRLLLSDGLQLEGLEAWVADEQPAGLDEAAARLRRLRDALRRLAADETADPREAARSAIRDRDAALRAVNDAAAAAPHWTALTWHDEGPERTAHSAATPGTAVAAIIAEQAIELFAGDLRAELRPCLAPGCVLYYVRRHPRRGWCSTGCGNRARAARHYLRHRGEG